MQSQSVFHGEQRARTTILWQTELSKQWTPNTNFSSFALPKPAKPIRGQVKNQRAFTNTRVFCVDQSLLTPSVAVCTRSLLFRALVPTVRQKLVNTERYKENGILLVKDQGVFMLCQKILWHKRKKFLAKTSLTHSGKNLVEQKSLYRQILSKNATLSKCWKHQWSWLFLNNFTPGWSQSSFIIWVFSESNMQ